MMSVTLHPMDARAPTFGPMLCRRFSLSLRYDGVREFKYEQKDDAAMRVIELPSAAYYLIKCEELSTNLSFGDLVERIKRQESTSRQLLREAVEAIETLRTERDGLS